jgi:hypothetical protein
VSYSPKLCLSLAQDCENSVSQLQALLVSLARAAQDLPDGLVKEHLSQGAGRRVGLLTHCLRRIFEIFPPSQAVPLERDALYDVQIAHHAFVMNLYGFFENLAWAFILRHDLERAVGGRKRVGLFVKATQAVLPAPLSSYLTSSQTSEWHDKYLKNYRDALAHRIPLYIPPATWTKDDVIESENLGVKEREAILERQWERLDEIRDRQATIGKPCLYFAHSFNDTDDPRPIYLHPQLLCDVKTVLDFAPRYLANWHMRA